MNENTTTTAATREGKGTPMSNSRRFVAVLTIAAALFAGTASVLPVDSAMAKSDKSPGRCYC